MPMKPEMDAHETEDGWAWNYLLVCFCYICFFCFLFFAIGFFL